jgi:hypothetical protein
LVDGLLAAIGCDEHGDWRGKCDVVLQLGFAVGSAVCFMVCSLVVLVVGVPALGNGNSGGR